MKYLLFSKSFVFFIILVAIASCDFDPGGNEDPCSGPVADYDRNIGTARLDSSIVSWIRIKPKTFRLINSNGANYLFSVSQSYGNFNEKVVGTELANSCGQTIDIIYDQEVDRLFIESNEIPLTIDIERFVDISKNEEYLLTDSTPNKTEEISFRLSRGAFRFNIKDSSSVFHSEYLFFESVYKDVWVIENKQKNSGLYPVKFILQNNVGLVGFELSNKEQWKRL